MELIQDYDMILSLNKAMHGGVSFVGHTYAQSNIPGTAWFNPKKPESTIYASDAVNLYGKLSVPGLYH